MHKVLRLLLLVALCCPAYALAVDQLNIDYAGDPDFLPYTLVEQYRFDYGASRIPVRKSLKVLCEGYGDTATVLLVRAFNGAELTDNPASLVVIDHRRRTTLLQKAIRGTIKDYVICPSDDTGDTLLVAACFRNDSAFLVATSLKTGSDQTISLAHGVDHTGDSQWQPSIVHLLTSDYDNDGCAELVFYLNPKRDLEPRVLYCVETFPLRLEWSLPVASPIVAEGLHVCRDSLGSGLLFAGYGPNNGVTDPVFDDRYGYMARVDTLGQIVYSKVISSDYRVPVLTALDPDHARFCLFRSIRDGVSPDSSTASPGANHLSIIDPLGNAIAAVEADGNVSTIWTGAYGPEGSPAIFTLGEEGRVCVYDTTLQLLAVSGHTNLLNYIGVLSLPGRDRDAYAFSTHTGIDVYSGSFSRLAHYDGSGHYLIPAQYDDRGRVVEFVTGWRNAGSVLEIERRSTLAIARILFWQYQDYIVISLVLLALGLVIVNGYRRRAEVRLRQNEQYLTKVFEDAEDFLYRTDENGKLLWVTPAGARLLGYKSVNELIGRNILDFYAHPEQRTAILERLYAEGHASNIEVELRKSDGETVTVSANSRVRRDADGRIIGVDGIVRDITERRRMEKALRESELKYRTLVESAQEGIFIHDQSGIFQYINTIGAKRLGGSPEDIVGKSVRDLFPPDEADRQMAYLQQVFDTGEGTMAEMTVHVGAENLWYNTSLQPITNEAGQVVQVLGVARNITPIIKSQQELKRERDFVNSLLQTANGLIMCLDGQFRITVFNTECERVTGYKRDEVLGRSWRDLFLPRDHQAHQIDDFAAWVRAHPEDKYEGPIITRSGEIRTILWSNSALISPDTDEITAIGVGQDITERKAAERALGTSEAFSRAVIEHSPLGVSVRNAKGKLLSYNKAWLDIWEIQPDNLQDYLTRDRDTLVFDHRDAYLGDWQPKVRAIYEQGGYLHVPEIDVTEPGQVRPCWVSQHFYAIMDDAGGVDRVVVMTEDISDRKLAEAALHQSERKFRDLAELAPEGIFEADLNGVITFANRKALEYFNYSEADMGEGLSALDMISPEDQPRAAENMQRLLGGERMGSNEYTAMRRDGSSFSVTIHSACVMQDGVAVGIRGVVTDTTERKLAEKALRESQHRYSLATAAGRVGVWDFDVSTGRFWIDPVLKANLGYSPDELPNVGESWVSLIHPDDRDSAVAAARAHIEGRTEEFRSEHRMMHRDGSIRWILARGQSIRDEDGKAVRIIGTDTDITERKLTESAAREAEARFGQVLKNSRDVLYRLNLATMTYDYISESVADIFGYTQEDVIEMGVAGMRELTHPGDLARLGDHRQNLIGADSGEDQSATTEYRLRCRDGQYRWLSDSHALIRDANGKPEYIIGSVRDISDRKRADEALEESEKRYRLLVENVPADIAVIDWDGVVHYANNVAGKTHGVPSESLIGRNVSEFFAPEALEFIMGAVRKVIETGEELTRELHADVGGAMRTFNGNIQPFNFGREVIRAALVIADDITERVVAEAALRESEERYRTLQENLPLAIFRSTPEGGPLSLNPAAAKMYGYDSVEEMLEIKPESSYASSGERNEILRRLEADGEITDYELQVCRKDGSIFWVSTSCRAVRDTDGRLLYWDGFDEDITERKQAELALRESEQRFRELVDLLPQVVFELDLNGNLTFINRQGLELSGYSLDDFDRGLSAREMFIPEDLDRLEENLRLSFTGEIPQGVEYTVARRDGGQIPVVTYASTIVREGNVVGIRGIVIDITDRKQAEEALRESESKFRTLAEQTLLGMVIFQGGRNVYVNQAACDITGYSIDAMLSMEKEQVAQVIHPDDRNFVMQQATKKMSGDTDGITTHYAYRIITKAGQVKWVDLYSRTISYRGQTADFLTLLDITDRKKAEDTLRYRMALEGLVASISTSFINLSTDEIDEEVDSALRLVGEFTGVDRSYVFSFTPDLKEMSNTYEWCAEGIERQKEKLQNISTEMQHWWMSTLKGHRPIYIPDVKDLPPEAAETRSILDLQSIKSLVVVPMIHTGRLLGFLGLDSVREARTWSEEDITLLKMVAEILVNAEQRMISEKEVRRIQQEKIDQAKQMAGGFAHEIRNALFPARGSLSKLVKTLRSGATDRKQLEKYPRIAEISLARAMDLTTLITQYTKLDTERMPEPVDLGAIINEVLASNDMRSRDQGVNIGLQRSSQVMVESNRGQLYSVVNNLLLNSLDALEETQAPQIDIAWHTSGNSVELTFADNGCGIDPERLGRVFDAFYSTKPGHGTGIGLATVRKIVELYGGTIRVSSELGRGTIFTVVMRRADD